MANNIYGKAREKFLTGQLNWLTVDIKALLIDTADYTVDINGHEFLNSIPAIARIAGSNVFTGKTAALGIADADNITFPLVTGDSIEAMVIYADTGSEATSTLIAYLDTGAGLPLTPNGGDIILNWDNGANKIFKL
jgi:hypothetical protein